MGFVSVGVGEVDVDHGRLINSLRALANIFRRSCDFDVASKILSVVLYDMGEHCKREEAIARELGIEERRIGALRREHRWMMDEYEYVRGVIKDGMCDGSDGVLLVEWLIEMTVAHIEVDKETFSARWRV